MSSATGDPQSTLDISAGEQVMVRVPPGENTCMSLPREAYGNLLLLSTGRQPNRIAADLDRIGIDPSDVGVIPITGTDVRYDGPMWVADRVGPGDLTGISIQFSNAMQYVSSDGWVCFDAVSLLAMYTDVRSLYRLLESVVRAVDERGARGVYTFVEDAMDGETMNSFRGLFDREVSVTAGDLD